jgi:hypothetical protein
MNKQEMIKRNLYIFILGIMSLPPFTECAQLSWTISKNVPTNAILYDITWTGSEYLACGAAGTLLRSSDADSWSVCSTGYQGDIKGIASNGSRMVIADGYGVRVSDNGKDWQFYSDVLSNRTLSTGFTNDIEWFNGSFMAVGEKGAFATSPDGIHWTKPSSGDGVTCNRLSKVGNYLAILGWGNIAFSTDGTSKSGSNCHSGPLYGIAFNGTTYLAVGMVGSIVTSKSKSISAWTEQSIMEEPFLSVSNYSFWDVVWTGSEFLCAGEAGVMFSTQDGTSWTKLTPPTKKVITRFLKTNDNSLIAVGDSGLVMKASLSSGVTTSFKSIPKHTIPTCMGAFDLLGKKQPPQVSGRTSWHGIVVLDRGADATIKIR